ncbi:hypothetical protein COEREDRAFT_12636 [Coemansia reversa NRRL 1564]|uniref:Uncharacterized protein n=1 Tax=Coemansia reversa (strain ATCC 12441 / NRRL 1564) TaxID=763665 RepID=A0A2G5B0I4_COERN|nr:hypothetical protein COEREDRAFT_12636 [Coemansia reversa NRRL 1564]|eukprot:PIA12535.1 hypothetical protein COEREDRAFT_12636 [Coemansia reversa NRRL 1564]
MNNMSRLYKFAVLRENSSAQDIHTWIRAWEVRGRNGLCLLNDALVYVEDSVLVRYDRWQQDANTTAGDSFENLKTFLMSQMGLGMTETGAGLELLSFPATNDIRQFNDTFLCLAQQAGCEKLQCTVGFYVKRMPLSICELIMTRPMEPTLVEAMNLVRIHVESVQAMYRNADPSAMVIAALEELGPFAGPHAAKKAKPVSNAGKSDCDADWLHQGHSPWPLITPTMEKNQFEQLIASVTSLPGQQMSLKFTDFKGIVSPLIPLEQKNMPNLLQMQ